MYAELEGEVEVDENTESALNKRKLDACNTESSTGGELHVPKITGHAAVDRLLQEAAEVCYIKDPMRAINLLNLDLLAVSDSPRTKL